MTPDDPYEGFLGSYLQQQETPTTPSGTEEARPGEWRNVWTWMELVEGEVLPASLEILGKGREIADQLGTRNCAVLFGHGVSRSAAQLAAHGADRVYVLDAPDYAEFQLDPAREALAALVRQRRPEILLFPATIQGRNLGAQVSMAARTGIVPNCEDLSLDASERVVIGHQTSFENRLLSHVLTPLERPQIFTITPGSFRRPALDATRTAQVLPVTEIGTAAPPRTRLLTKEADRPRTLPQHDAVVVGGLGLASPASFALAQELAQELKAFAGATRGAVACGWVDRDRLITGVHHRLRPRLYVACGVIGEYDHLKAIEGAELIVALSADPNAPICENADLIGLGDPSAILERLVPAIRASKQDRVTIP